MSALTNPLSFENWYTGSYQDINLSEKPALAIWPESLKNTEVGSPICLVSPIDQVTTDDLKNANLIAAAPTMYNTLTGLLEWAEDGLQSLGAEVQEGANYTPEQIQDAIEPYMSVIMALRQANPALFYAEPDQAVDVATILD